MAAMVFFVWPNLDLQVAARFALGSDRFVGQGTVWDAVRRVFYWAPFGIFLLLAALYALRRFAGLEAPAPTTAGLLFLALSLALGPGLLVNAVLKDHSHRPRPYQTREFGGDETFRPFWRFDGECRRNCSFVSGEGSAAFWTVAPALLAPPPLQGAAVAGAVVFGIATSVMRMVSGGHYLSDTVFAGLLTWLVVLLCWRLVQRALGVNPTA